MIGREAQVLEALRPFELPVPAVLASDPDGICSGRAALLMTPARGARPGEVQLRAAIEPDGDARALSSSNARSRGWPALRALVRPRRRSRRRTGGISSRSGQRGVDTVQRQAPHGGRFHPPRPSSGQHALRWTAADRAARRVERRARGAERGRRPHVSELAVLLDVEAAAEFRDAWETPADPPPRSTPRRLRGSEQCAGSGAAPNGTQIGLPIAGREMIERLEAFLEDSLRRMRCAGGR